MKVHWSKEKCGDPLLIVNGYTLHEILRKEGLSLAQINRIKETTEKSSIGSPFEHLQKLDLDALLEPPEQCEGYGISIASSIRGRVMMPTKLERNFWDRFGVLCCDDPEDEHNEIIRELRSLVINYFKKINGEDND